MEDQEGLHNEKVIRLHAGNTVQTHGSEYCCKFNIISRSETTYFMVRRCHFYWMVKGQA